MISHVGNIPEIDQYTHLISEIEKQDIMSDESDSVLDVRIQRVKEDLGQDPAEKMQLYVQDKFEHLNLEALSDTSRSRIEQMMRNIDAGSIGPRKVGQADNIADIDQEENKNKA